MVQKKCLKFFLIAHALDGPQRVEKNCSVVQALLVYFQNRQFFCSFKKFLKFFADSDAPEMGIKAAKKWPKPENILCVIFLESIIASDHC